MRDLDLFHSLWTDQNSAALRAAGSNTLLVAFYVISNPNANNIGFYHLPLVAIAAATTLPLQEVREAISNLEHIGFVRYHYPTGMIWVIQWACKKMGQLRSNDKTRIAIANAEYAAIPKTCPMRTDFFWKHSLMLRLSVAGSINACAQVVETECELEPDLVPRSTFNAANGRALAYADI
jgi:hypothetical protein